jgi:hypothetical protein
MCTTASYALAMAPSRLRCPGGAGTGSFQGTFAQSNSPGGAVTGYYYDGSFVAHGFLRAPDGTFTTFDVPGAGTGSFEGTLPSDINPAGTIAGFYFDASFVSHGFARASNGTFTTFDAPGAGTSPGYETVDASCSGLNPEGHRGKLP